MRLLRNAVTLGAALFSGSLTVALPPPAPSPSPTAVSVAPSDREMLKALAAQIKGREKEPAESVFRNIQILKGRPAIAVLGIMDIGYNRSLGVSCSYCHDSADWASEIKAEKQVARRMSAMVRDINEKYLPAIDGLKSDKPVVNCTTCHRGHEKPALDLEPAPTAGH